ncbi:BTAD domain-containing putative transcriptional regulator [Actinoplanes sp. CA-030573]|uniref:BTAD domain-containing putative transcriptional regulator n=1 Tax=Actinoplanes sp. CA-030573 TaxID=3239898 RepID=UPI003D95071A
MLVVAVLGPVEVRLGNARVAVPGGKTTEVLIRLALEAGRPVRADRLIEDLWAGAPVSRNSLQAKVSKLRRALGDPSLVSGDGFRYTLHVEPAAVDALEALRLAEIPAGEGLALFRGDVLLPDAGDGAWLEPWRARLTDARLRLAEAHYAEHGSIAELETLVAAHPLREALWELLITALYRDGRQGEALAACRRARATLAGELGVDPGPSLRDLERRILVQDAALAPPAGNLPALSESIVGRASDISEISLLLDESRLVTLVGPAGVGKTRLALARTGGWLVRLESAGSLWPAIGAAFGIAEATGAMVLDRLRGLRTLLILDNCEHLADRLVPVVERILGAAPGVTILATSQVPLHIPGEMTYAVKPLPPVFAAELFRDRASRHRPIAAGEDVAAVVRRLDGLPLAIELAAARAKALPPPEIARRLDDRFTVLTDPNSRLPARQRTLRAAIGWSYDLLSPDDRRGLQALSVFASGAPLEAADAVMVALGVPADAALDVLDRLVDRSLTSASMSGGAVRYRLLESVRAFAREQLAVPADSYGAAASRAAFYDAASAAHAAFYGAAASRASAGLRGPAQAEHLAFVRAESAEIDAAPDAPVGDRVDALLFAAWFEASGGDLDRAFADVAAARALAPLPRTLLFRAFLHSQQGRPAEALAALDEFRPVARGWERGAACLLVAWSRIALGDTAGARAACDEALSLLDDAWALSHAEALLGGLAQAEHRFADAVAHLTRAAGAAHRLGFAAAEALHLANLGRAQQQDGAPVAALDTLDRAAATAERVGEMRGVAFARTRRARVLRALGRLDECRADLRVARARYATAGGGDGDLLSALLLAALDDDRPALERVLADARAAGDAETELLTLDELGRLTGDPALSAAADALLPAAAHLVTPADRLSRR